MTKRQRAQVVELLRCAADWAACGRRSWLDVVAFHVGSDNGTIERARAIGVLVQDEEPYRSERANFGGDIMPPEWCVRVALEAAQRVEEGEWP